MLPYVLFRTVVFVICILFGKQLFVLRGTDHVLFVHHHVWLMRLFVE